MGDFKLCFLFCRDWCCRISANVLDFAECFNNCGLEYGHLLALNDFRWFHAIHLVWMDSPIRTWSWQLRLDRYMQIQVIKSREGGPTKCITLFGILRLDPPFPTKCQLLTETFQWIFFILIQQNSLHNDNLDSRPSKIQIAWLKGGWHRLVPPKEEVL